MVCAGVDILGSPFSVAVIGGPGDGASTAAGAALTQAIAGVQTAFTITARDAGGNPTLNTGMATVRSDMNTRVAPNCAVVGCWCNSVIRECCAVLCSVAAWYMH